MGPLSRALLRYRQYYALSDNDRLVYVIALLRHRAAEDEPTARKLAHLRAFRIVPVTHGLRGGHVRNVASGEVYVHRSWTSDPWLLIGLALRRSPWIFDPRVLRRPFRYHTESNPLMTRFVLGNARLSPPFTLYQFGHETKAAATGIFYSFLRLLHVRCEPYVSIDGSFPFDLVPTWLCRCVSDQKIPVSIPPLWSVADTLLDVQMRLEAGEHLSPAKIAADYTFPLQYVEEVLWPQVQDDGTFLSGVLM
jgi:hypothetical protein